MDYKFNHRITQNIFNLSYIFLKDLFILFYVCGCWFACMYKLHMCVLGTNHGSLQEQSVIFTTELSFQPPVLDW